MVFRVICYNFIVTKLDYLQVFMTSFSNVNYFYTLSIAEIDIVLFENLSYFFENLIITVSMLISSLVFSVRLLA